MLCHRNELRTEAREKARGGNGTVNFLHLVEGKRVQKNTNMLAELTLPPGASIGPHSHTDETEFFVILKGNGTVNDNGTEKPITEGDVMITVSGETHSIANTGNVPLVLHAVIVQN
ncbi:MAG: cupin domain-containing protein [Treponema sp.]|jgi:mannose-6-phosphate isomerase-like protein (cupin superfamily)|nr:cupin domain-containing protein [Treponema sp.]